MFTGLVETLGTVVATERTGRGLRLSIEADFGPYVLGESIAVNGACLTVSASGEKSGAHGDKFSADVSEETVAKTTLGAWIPRRRVNLERAARLGSSLGGHLVLGHVDERGTLVSSEVVDEARHVRFRVSQRLSRYVAAKGSIAIDGVSLTVNEVQDEASATTFSVMLVPHTLKHTILGTLAVGADVNVEVDVLARYAARILEVKDRAGASGLEEASDRPYGTDVTLLAKLKTSGYTD